MTELQFSLVATDKAAQYDMQAKRLLGHKSILSQILVRTVDEFCGMTPAEVEACIEGDPIIGVVPTEPGLTNAAESTEDENGQRIRGFNTEQGEIHEGLILYDIIFYVRMRDGLSQIIINVEAQKSEPTEYDILNRAIFYVSRLISSQKERDFVKKNYNDLKRVYSIWICMDMKECVWDYIHLTDEKILGSHVWKGRLDLFNIVMIGLPKKLPEKGEQYELHRLLTALLSVELPAKEKLRIIGDEYGISTKTDAGRETGEMCNLGQGVLELGFEKGIEKGIAVGLERGIEQGIERGIEQGLTQGHEQGRRELIANMHRVGISVVQIAKAAELSEDEVLQILAEVAGEE